MKLCLLLQGFFPLNTQVYPSDCHGHGRETDFNILVGCVPGFSNSRRYSNANNWGVLDFISN